MKDDLQVPDDTVAVFCIHGSCTATVEIRAYVDQDGNLDVVLVGAKMGRLSVQPRSSNRIVVSDVR